MFFCSRKLQVVVALFLSCWCLSNANSIGAPCGAYDTMTPQHGGAYIQDAVATRSAPYRVRVLDSSGRFEVNRYEDGGVYVVEISALEPIKGLLLQARRLPFGMQVGEFTPTVDFDRYCLKHQRCGFRIVRESVTHDVANCPTRLNCSASAPCVFSVLWHVTDTPRNVVRLALTAVREYGYVFVHVFSQMLEPVINQGSSIQRESFEVAPAGHRTFVCDNLHDSPAWLNWCPSYCEEPCCRNPLQKPFCKLTCCRKNIF